jgi:hypothetical protein
MRHETDLTELEPGLVRPVLKVIGVLLPRGVRSAYLADIGEYYRSLRQFLPESIVTIACSYFAQARAAFDKVAYTAHIFAAAFCFAASGVPLGLSVAIGAVLAALVLRDAYTHPFEGETKKAWEKPPAPPFVLDCLTDAAIAGLFLMAAHAALYRVSPSMAMPTKTLFHGALIYLPTMATLRMLMRPKPWGKIPFRRSTMTPEAIYWATWRLTILWFAAIAFTVWTSPIAIPKWVPFNDTLHGLLPPLTFAVWRRVQRDAIQKGVVVETLRRQHKNLRREWMQANLLKGVKRRSPFYRGYVILEALFFFQILAPLAMGIWPWLSGGEPGVDLFRLFFNLATFATLALSWRQVKMTNRVASMVIRRAVRAQKAKEAAEGAF